MQQQRRYRSLEVLARCNLDAATACRCLYNRLGDDLCYRGCPPQTTLLILALAATLGVTAACSTGGSGEAGESPAANIDSASGPTGTTDTGTNDTAAAVARTPDGTYTSDWVWSADTGDLDECNGAEIEGQYASIITDEYPYIGRCLNGAFEASAPGGGR